LGQHFVSNDLNPPYANKVINQYMLVAF